MGGKPVSENEKAISFSKKHFSALPLILFCFLLLLFPLVTNAYKINPDQVNIVSGDETGSSSYTLVSTIGESIAGELSSENYILQIGWVPTILNNRPIVFDENISPAVWVGGSDLILGFKCRDIDGIGDFNSAHASITGANTQDLNNIPFVISDNKAIIAFDINSYITIRGTYYVTPFCDDNSHTTTAGTTLTGEYAFPIEINVQSPVQDANINSNPTITFDVNKNSIIDVNQYTIEIDLNGIVSTDFNVDNNCTEFSGEFYCSYVETGLAIDADNNVVFKAADDSNNWATPVERIVHYDATAPVVTSISAAESGSNVVVSWTGQDPFTGIETYYVREDSGSWIRTGLVLSYTFAGSAAASHTYYAKATDYADNNSLIVQTTYTPPGPPTPPAPGPGPGGGAGPPPPTLPPLEDDFNIILVRIDDPAEVGEKLDFTYRVTNGTRSGDNAYIEYWLSKGKSKVVSGSETVYLVSGERREINSNLLLLDDMDGFYPFHLKLSKEGQDDVEVERIIMVGKSVPTKIEIDITSLWPGGDSVPLSFSLEIGSNKDAVLPVLINEKLYRDGSLVWEKKQTVAVQILEKFSEEVYGLEPGNYLLEVNTVYQGETVTDTQPFEIKPTAGMQPIIPLPPLIEPIVTGLFEFFPWILAAVIAIIALVFLVKKLKDRRKNKIIF